VRVGIILPMFSGDAGLVLDAAREAERFGFDGAFAFDHFFPPGGRRDAPSLEAFTTLAATAAVTERIVLGSLVTRVSLRPVGLLGKLASWLDAASGGRLILGLGTGDASDDAEHEAYGIRMRGKQERRTELHETIEALRALFRGAGYPGGGLIPAIEGPLVPPARPGGPPIWVGGHTEPLVRMAARLADGWNGWGLTPERFAATAALLGDEAATHERAVDPTWAGIVVVGEDRAETEALMARRRERGLEGGAWSGTTEDLVSFLRQLKQAGATWAVLVTGGPRDRRELVAREVLPHL
jgi:alkanesulfonate monooxygenase SsuD/methylene tetrahydromethanopterin reductase-like flavin-dependent oxidoreductase (luciferase family)